MSVAGWGAPAELVGAAKGESVSSFQRMNQDISGSNLCPGPGPVQHNEVWLQEVTEQSTLNRQLAQHLGKQTTTGSSPARIQGVQPAATLTSKLPKSN